MSFNIQNYGGNLQAAINAALAQGGGEVYVPATTTAYFQGSSSVTINVTSHAGMSNSIVIQGEGAKASSNPRSRAAMPSSSRGFMTEAATWATST